ncbi:Ferroporti-1 [Lipomyces oligophaga]|uniref:Ferroporti-1 n=1 Tax=Lipomyces oligophaga TaxID=45792 RepID=UPI0034CF8EC5
MAIDGPILRRICVSHSFSAWNDRVFQFSAVLILAIVYPGTLLPASVYALSRSVVAIVFAPKMGEKIEKIDRLVVVRRSIVFQRIAVVLSAVVFLLMIQFRIGQPTEPMVYKVLSLFALSVFACIEKLAAVVNTVSIERDWVVVIADSDTEGLRHLNSIMRRIDLFCKLAGPLAISFIVASSVEIAAWVILGSNALSVFVEYFTVARVYYVVPALASRRAPDCQGNSAEFPLSADDSSEHVDSVQSAMPVKVDQQSALSRYIHHDLFFPSFALALLYFNILSFGGQLVTYLIATGYSASMVGVLRSIAAVFELAATWFAPISLNRIGPVRSSLRFVSFEAVCIIIASVAIYLTPVSTPDEANSGKFLHFFSSKSTFVALVAVIFSRVGLWGFDLSVQSLIQEEVEADFRTSFSSIESSFQNGFELLLFGSTIFFATPAVFWIPCMLTMAFIILAVLCTAIYTRKVRKHLIHLPQWFSKPAEAYRVVNTVLDDQIEMD